MELVNQRAPVTSRMDGWPECFQDLRSWCHTDQDELHTPQITMQDEFNFSLDGQVNSGNWELANTPVEINESWVNQDLLLASPNNFMIKDEENNNFEFQSNFSTAYMKGDSLNNSASQPKAAANASIASNNYSVLKTKGNVLLSQVSILPEDAPFVDNRDNYTDFIKLNSSTSARLGSGGKLIKNEEPCLESPIQIIGSRPKLKLNIPQPQTQAQAQGQVGCTLTTPEVLKPLTDLTSSGFDLLNYVCGDSQESGNRQIVVAPKKEEEIRIPDHDYVESKNSVDEEVYIKCEPMSPTSMGITDRRTSLIVSSMDVDDELLDSFDEDEEEETEEWFPSSGRGKRSGPGRRRSRKGSSLDSSDGGSINDRYRALRDRNNEASRRSRLNRKERDTEMRGHKSDLEKKNVELRVKADRMEALVKDMRAILLKAVRSRNQQPQRPL